MKPEVGGVDYTAISQAIRRLESRARKDRETAAEMKSFRSKLEEMYNVDCAEKHLRLGVSPICIKNIVET